MKTNWTTKSVKKYQWLHKCKEIVNDRVAQMIKSVIQSNLGTTEEEKDDETFATAKEEKDDSQIKELQNQIESLKKEKDEMNQYKLEDDSKHRDM